jgi:hypothetical protein
MQNCDNWPMAYDGWPIKALEVDGRHSDLTKTDAGGL